MKKNPEITTLPTKDEKKMSNLGYGPDIFGSSNKPAATTPLEIIVTAIVAPHVIVREIFGLDK